MNTLFITRHDPFLRSGGSLATKSYIQAFSDMSNGQIDVILASSCKVDKSIEVREYFYVSQRSYLSRLLSLFSGTLHRYKNYVLRNLSNAGSLYDLCVLDGSIVSGDLVDFFNGQGVKTLTIFHNCEREYHVDNRTVESLYGIFPYFINRNEKKAYQRSTLKVFLTSDDEIRMTSLYGKVKGRSLVGGAFEPKESGFVHLKERVTGPELNIVISGSMNSFQTIYGVKEFFRDYYAITKDIVCNVRITIVGRDPSPELYEIMDEIGSGISIVPNPENIFDVVSDADIFLCPTSIGGGIKYRILDGMKLGLPILTHSQSAKGYDLVLSQPWFQVYNDRTSFREGLLGLISYVQFRGSPSAQIQDIYSKHYTYASGLERLKKLWI